MKLKKVQIHNWNGKKFEFAPKKLVYVFHENGYGKSSLLNALRYGISGSLPKARRSATVPWNSRRRKRDWIFTGSAWPEARPVRSAGRTGTAWQRNS